MTDQGEAATGEAQDPRGESEAAGTGEQGSEAAGEAQATGGFDAGLQEATTCGCSSTTTERLSGNTTASSKRQSKVHVFGSSTDRLQPTHFLREPPSAAANPSANNAAATEANRRSFG